MELKVGGTYLRRDGAQVNIVRKVEGAVFPFHDENKTTYRPDGKYQVATYHESPSDIVRELFLEEGDSVIKNGEATFIYSKEEDKHEIISRS